MTLFFFSFPRGPRGRRIRGKGYVGEGEVGLEYLELQLILVFLLEPKRQEDGEDGGMLLG